MRIKENNSDERREWEEDRIKRDLLQRGYDIIDETSYVNVIRSSGKIDQDWQVFGIKRRNDQQICAVYKWDDESQDFLTKKVPLHDLQMWGNNISRFKDKQEIKLSQQSISSNISSIAESNNKSLRNVLLSEDTDKKPLFIQDHKADLPFNSDSLLREKQLMFEQNFELVKATLSSIEKLQQFIQRPVSLKDLPLQGISIFQQEKFTNLIDSLIMGRDVYLELKARATNKEDRTSYENRSREFEECINKLLALQSES